MNDKHKTLDLAKVQAFLKDSNITVIQFLDNSKASEYYIRAMFEQNDRLFLSRKRKVGLKDSCKR